ncbi:alpha/beta fold hydrolase [Asticcacaulis sp. ZE23SCel15]|uniref:alpha/beta hydrolase n=1 Tax=Asticcacaulis sp. ZE23SCel15 TaxID=3059027 RepID=UPI002660493C|nr:alpha/beta fold hydrolase [Asticcacaulis sp. ZE23SCel15]WKL57977.1 alpha/beta fold hydrolase [Asticcacaulis sp. ZE23SCel15]
MFRVVTAAMLAALWVGVATAQTPQTPPAPYRPADSHINPELLTPQLTDVGGGRRMHMACEGTGSPTVVFDQGGEGAIPNWRFVQPYIAKITHTCVYDRAGFGLSDPPTVPVTGTSTTDDLRTLLKLRGEMKPIVIVGHSIGGFYGTLYTNRFPDHVAGLVLVDSGFAGQNNPADPEDRRRLVEDIDKGNGELAKCAQMAREKQLTGDDLKGCFKMPGGMSETEKAYTVQALIDPKWHEAELSQSLNYFPSADHPESLMWREERLTKRDYGDLPLVVLSAGKLPRGGFHTDASFAEFRSHWRAGHEQLAKRSTRGEFIFIPDAGHFIQRNRPDIVIDAITRVVDIARDDAKP